MKTLLSNLYGLLHSKTFWVNAGYSVLAILDYAGQTDYIKNNPDVAFLIVTVSNVLLRFVTKVPLTAKGFFRGK